jgi:hypothetical protein
MTQDPASTPADALGELVDELVRVGASLSQIVAHMDCAPVRGGVRPPGQVLTRLLRDVVGPALDGHAVSELLDAAGIVSCAADAIEREVQLVPHE